MAAEARETKEKERSLEETLSRVQLDKEAELARYRQTEEARFKEKEDELARNRADLELQVHTLETHLRETQDRLAEIESQKIGLESASDAEKARCYVLQQKLENAEKQSSAERHELERTITMKHNQEADRLRRELEKERGTKAVTKEAVMRTERQWILHV